MASKGSALKRIADSAVLGGVTRGIFILLSNDTKAVIEAANYLNDDAFRFSAGKGDLLMVAIDLDGTASLGMYLVSVASGVVTLTPFPIGS